MRSPRAESPSGRTRNEDCLPKMRCTRSRFRSRGFASPENLRSGGDTPPSAFPLFHSETIDAQWHAKPDTQTQQLRFQMRCVPVAMYLTDVAHRPTLLRHECDDFRTRESLESVRLASLLQGEASTRRGGARGVGGGWRAKREDGRRGTSRSLTR